jgi:hypothetical protein
MATKQPQLGQQYRSVGTAFHNSVWILTSIFSGPEGIEHAHLTSAYDSTQRKTLALSVITDMRQFMPIKMPNEPAD